MSVVTAEIRATTSVQALAPAVRATGLCKLMDDRPVLSDIDLEITPGSYVGLLGANGAGKSTLLKILATLLPATSGELQLFGQTVSRSSVAIRAKIGLIGHQPMLYRDLTLRENLMFFGRLYGLRNVVERSDELLEVVSLADRANDAVRTFSRGMTQRASIARALMHAPELLLADEPFAGLDAPSTVVLEGLLNRLHSAGKTIVLVNHDIAQTLSVAGRVIVLRAGRLAIDRPARHLDAATVLREVSAA